MATLSVANTLRRSLLIKLISKPTPSRDDVASVIELTASKVVEALQAQSMTLYLVEGNDIAFKQIYYSPTLWGKDAAKEKKFRQTSEKLLAMKLPLGTGNVGKVIATGEPLFFSKTGPDAESLKNMSTGFEVLSMLTVPLKTDVVIGAIQVLNKELGAGTDGLFTERDLELLKEVAEYSATLLHRMLDPKFQIGADDTARFVAKLTDQPLITKAEEIEIDGKLATKTGLEAERHAKHTAQNLLHLTEDRPLEKYAIRASTDNQVALISLGCDCAVGVVGKMCIGVPTRLIYSVKSWIDKSFIKRFK